MLTENINNNEDTETFSIQDLVFTLHMYEICAQRGSFIADELSTVGLVYDRLKSFLIKNNAITIEPTPDKPKE